MSIMRVGKVSLLMLSVVLLTTACRNPVAAYVYSGVDPLVKPTKTEPIIFMLPKDPSIRERNVAILLKDELTRNGFNLVDNSKLSAWTVTFNVDRQTYTIGSTSSGVAFGSSNSSVVATRSETRYVNQTDIIIYMYLIRTADIEKEKPTVIWEGSVRTKDRYFKAFPNATIKNLLDQFGNNYEQARTRINKEYQEEITKPKTQ